MISPIRPLLTIEDAPKIIGAARSGIIDPTIQMPIRSTSEPPSLIGRVQSLPSDPLSFEDNAELLLEYFINNGFSQEAFTAFSKLSGIQLHLLLISLQRVPLWFFASYISEYVEVNPEGDFTKTIEALLTRGIDAEPEAKKPIEIFLEKHPIDQASFADISDVAKALYRMAKEDPKSPSDETKGLDPTLIHCSPGLQAVLGDQHVYQSLFTETDLDPLLGPMLIRSSSFTFSFFRSSKKQASLFIGC